METFFLVTKTTLEGPRRSYCSGFEITLNYKNHFSLDYSGRLIGPSQRSPPNKTRHSQATDFHGPDGVRSGNRNNREVADLRLRPSGHRDRRFGDITPKILNLGTRNLRIFSFTLLPIYGTSSWVTTGWKPDHDCPYRRSEHRGEFRDTLRLPGIESRSSIA